MHAYLESDVLAAVGRNILTVIFFNREGFVVELQALKEVPTPELFLKLKNRHKPGAFRFVPQGRYSSGDYRRWVAEALEGMALAEQGELRPGANCFFS